MMDQWSLEPPQIQVGLKQFGSPKGTFGPQSYVAGTDAAKAALREQTANAEAVEKVRKAALAQQELERQKRHEEQDRRRREEQAREEQTRLAFEKQKALLAEQRESEEQERQAAAQHERQRLILATLPGTNYVGTISSGDQCQRLRLVFTEQDNFLIRARAYNPDRPKESQTFNGQLIFDPKPEQDDQSVAYTIVLSPVARQGYQYGRWAFYDREGSVRLRLTDAGLEGIAEMQWPRYVIRLQRVGGPLPSAPRLAASRPASDSHTRNDRGLAVPPPRRPIADR